jgi:hypothetical protein
MGVEPRMRDADEAQGWALIGGGVVVAAIAAQAKKRARRARDAYVKEVSAGSKPIEAVGTAIAAFVGFEQH